ncbi:MAG: response regulator [Candidatus Wallbacteria bacterium HGW-Wallbacteria-1]|uniref:Response regulator n=1 Tax=Candidatus Wallbacteria bacterium HGW-Wallbacteria-1 TaxID=2013854 RepID=A0A2N1PN17_9BACT|nr:MAG: response regulator [Candidatus Wallbacteria bacterium HGW-Wallbacteria-1]
MENSEKRLILAVDDEYANLFLLKGLLENRFRIIEAKDGQEAVDTALRERPDLILMDVMMPVMTGLQACAALKERAETRDIPIIMITAKTGDESLKNALEVGAFDYVTKPFSEVELVARMGNALKLRDQIDTLKKLNLEKAKLIIELRDAFAQVKTLRGLLPICSSCKKIRNDGGYWSQIEEYITLHSDAVFSHGICPDCARNLYPDFFDE